MADIIGRIGGTYKHPVVDEIPDELRADEIVFVTETGSLWVGASENTFPTLDEGTPWPLKGYKEFHANISVGDSILAVEAYKTDVGIPYFERDGNDYDWETGLASGSIFPYDIAGFNADIGEIFYYRISINSAGRVRINVVDENGAITNPDGKGAYSPQEIYIRIYPPSE